MERRAPTHFCPLTGGMADSSTTVDRCEMPPYPLVQYINWVARLDGWRFVAMHLAGGDGKIHDGRNRGLGGTTVGALIKQWWHWEACSATGSRFHYYRTNSPFVQRL